MGNFSKSLGVAIGLITFSALAQVSEGNSAVEQYRIQSHYGPEEALLSPLFPRDGKVEISGGAGLAPFSSLVDSWGYQGSLIYHINRRHAVEPVYYVSSSSVLSSFVKEQIASKIDASTRAALSIAAPKQMLAASYFFSPYHAKLHLSERSVSHFDVYLGLGAGAVQTESVNLNEVVGDATWTPAGLVTLGVRMLFQPRFALRLEARDFVHRTDNFGKRSTTHSFQLGLSASMVFGSYSSF